MLRLNLYLLMFLIASPAGAESHAALAAPGVDAVVVSKSERQLRLVSDGETVASYRVSLGREPTGDKIAAGDQRTPEGRYTLDWRNPDSGFYKSIHISYPNQADRKLAQAWGLDPGGSIMIHGLPNQAAEWAFAFEGLDWTQGCIAVNNDAMDEIWARVPAGTPIEIRP